MKLKVLLHTAFCSFFLKEFSVKNRPFESCTMKQCFCTYFNGQSAPLIRYQSDDHKFHKPFFEAMITYTQGEVSLIGQKPNVDQSITCFSDQVHAARRHSSFISYWICVSFVWSVLEGCWQLRVGVTGFGGCLKLFPELTNDFLKVSIWFGLNFTWSLECFQLFQILSAMNLIFTHLYLLQIVSSEKYVTRSDKTHHWTFW